MIDLDLLNSKVRYYYIGFQWKHDIQESLVAFNLISCRYRKFTVLMFMWMFEVKFTFNLGRMRPSMRSMRICIFLGVYKNQDSTNLHLGLKPFFLQFTYMCIYLIIQFKNLLTIRVLKIDPSVLGF